MSYLEFGVGDISPCSFTLRQAFHRLPKPPFSWFAGGDSAGVGYRPRIMPRLVPMGAVWQALRKVGMNLLKLGVNLVRLLLLLCRNECSESCYSQWNFKRWFPGQAGLDPGIVLSPLLFMTVLDILSREIILGCQKELLYADDLTVSETV